MALEVPSSLTAAPSTNTTQSQITLQNLTSWNGVDQR
jgi:hypothetical protein